MTRPFTAAAICAPGDHTESLALGQHLIRIASADTGGRIGIWEDVVGPDEGTPPHIHHREDEVFYVLEGTFRIWCGEETFVAGPGATTVLPKGIRHNFLNIGGSTGRLLVTVTPGGFERFFLDLAKLPSLEWDRVARLGEEYGLEFLPAEAEA